MQTTSRFLALLGSLGLLFAANLTVLAQTATPLWQPVAGPAGRGQAQTKPGRWFRLDTTQLVAGLRAGATLALPHPDGTLHRYVLTPTPVLAPALAARFPGIRTFAGSAPDEPATAVRLEWTPAGLHAQLLTPAGTLVIARPSAADPTLYQARAEETPAFDCQALRPPGLPQGRAAGGTPPLPPAPYGSQIRTLRLALAATGEYVQQLGGGTELGTLGSMATLVNSLNAVYERDLALRLQLVANNNLLIFLDAATDPYATTSVVDLMNTTPTVLNDRIGFTNYDLGHVLSYRSGGYSGVAYVGVVCNSNLKGAGASTGASASLMNIVTRHELGHQLGSSHTFNGDKNICAGNRIATLAYEPGAGNTIMSYDSRCSPDNVGPGIEYFHAGSLSVIMPLLTCGTSVSTGNQPPSVSVPSGYTIPKGTPFSLTGSASDANGDALTYSWEELDLGNPSGLAGAATDASGPPLFRSFEPASTPTRIFPQLSAVLGNTTSVGEILPLVARSLNFRLTVRDNRGGVAGANAALTVADAGPFRVTTSATPETLPATSSYRVTWDVLGTDQAPVNCANVRILFSRDGGLTFPTTLLATTPNDGEADVQLPNVETTQGRLKVEALNNVFFAVSPATLTLTGPLPVALVQFTAEAEGSRACLRWNTATELRNAGFAVEVSTDGTTFRHLSWVPARGHAATYTLCDDHLTGYGRPVVYYRLRQHDDDGTQTLSGVRSVVVPARAADFQLWPNPARTVLTVAGLPAGQSVQLLDLTGRVLLTASMPPTGPLHLRLPAPLRAGLYVVRSGPHTQRLVVE